MRVDRPRLGSLDLLRGITVAGMIVVNNPGNWNSVDACNGDVWYIEESLDVTAVHDIAPDANVVYVAAASCQDNDLEEAQRILVKGPDMPTQPTPLQRGRLDIHGLGHGNLLAADL